MTKYFKLGLSVVITYFIAKLIVTSVFAQNVYSRSSLAKGNIEISVERKIQWNAHSLFADSIYHRWAKRDLNPDGGKVNNPRILLAKLLLKKDLADVNATILKTVPWGVTGSTWAMNKNGDYDFTMTVLTTILYLFGNQPSILFPETTQHLVDVLLIEEGGKFRYKTPNTMGMVDETENHLLMTEGSRYLKNQWKKVKGNNNPLFDNIANGMEDKLSALLIEMGSAGLYEFNSLPYTGYTITALLNLEAFASDKIRKEARAVLDYMNWCYAIGSYQFKHFAPMRRRYDKVNFDEITNDYHSVFMKSWIAYLPNIPPDHNVNGSEVHAIMGSCMPYRPTDQVVQLLFDKGNGYFIKIGHGDKTCPEIYAAGNKYLLSAGGTNRGKASDIVARPIMLFLDDHAEKLDQSFHLSGPGTDFMRWNNTGVYQSFACAAGPVFIPKGQVAITENENWKIYQTPQKLLIAVYSNINFGILWITDKQNPQTLLQKLIQTNSDNNSIETEFQIPGGNKITYDVHSPNDKWVIKTVDAKPLNRDFDKWPLIDGIFNKLNK